MRGVARRSRNLRRSPSPFDSRSIRPSIERSEWPRRSSVRGFGGVISGIERGPDESMGALSGAQLCGFLEGFKQFGRLVSRFLSNEAGVEFLRQAQNLRHLGQAQRCEMLRKPRGTSPE